MAKPLQKAVDGPLPKRPRRWIRTAFCMTLVLSPIVAAVVLAAQAPAFYVERLRGGEEAKIESLANQFLSRGSRLYNSIINGGGVWKESFDEPSINAWLAYDLKRNHQRSLPNWVSEPRVALEDDCLRIGFQWGIGSATTVVQVSLKTWVPKENDLAVELKGAKAGRLPLPTTYVRRLIESVAQRNGCEVRWKRHGANLVAIITLPAGNRGVTLRRADVKHGAVTLSGRSVGIISFKPETKTLR
jgi:hypothetical protein